MRTRKDYELALEVIGAVIRSWDPYDLLAGGAPASEFDGEIAKLATYVPQIHSGADAAQALSLVFGGAYEALLFTPVACAEVGEQLFAGLSQAGLISGPNNSFKPNLSAGAAKSA